MDDCIKVLQKSFETPLPDQWCVENQKEAWENLHGALYGKDRKLLLRLVDANNLLLEESTLHSFTCGLRLGMTIVEILHKPYLLHNGSCTKIL